MTAGGSLRRDRRFWLGVAVSAACVAVLASKADLEPLGRALRSAGLAALAATLMPKAASFFCLAGRSRALFRRFGSWPQAPFLRAHLLGFGGNIVLPLRMGELLRWRELSRGTGVDLPSTAGVLAVERALDLIWLLVLAVSLPFFVTLELPLPATLTAWLSAMVLVMALAVWLGRQPWLTERVVAIAARLGGERFTPVLEPLARGLAGALATIGSLRRLAAASAWTVGYWSCSISGVALWLVAFDLHPPWFAAPVVIVFLALGAAVPAAPGYVGTYHLAVVTALRLMGVETNTALAVAVAGHFFSTVPAALLAIALFFDRLRRPSNGGDGASPPSSAGGARLGSPT